MSPARSGGYGSCNESTEGGGRPRSMIWFATHRIVYSPQPNETEAIDVMAWDRGADAPGPGRYALYTEENWETESEAEWTMNSEGQVWFQGESLPREATAVVEEVLD